MSQKWRAIAMILYHGTNVDFDKIDISYSYLSIMFIM